MVSRWHPSICWEAESWAWTTMSLYTTDTTLQTSMRITQGICSGIDGSRIKHAVRILDWIQSMQGTVVLENQLKMRIAIDWAGHVDACVTSLELLGIFSAANLSLPHLLGTLMRDRWVHFTPMKDTLMKGSRSIRLTDVNRKNKFYRF